MRYPCTREDTPVPKSVWKAPYNTCQIEIGIVILYIVGPIGNSPHHPKEGQQVSVNSSWPGSPTILMHSVTTIERTRAPKRFPVTSTKHLTLIESTFCSLILRVNVVRSLFYVNPAGASRSILAPSVPGGATKQVRDVPLILGHNSRQF